MSLSSRVYRGRIDPSAIPIAMRRFLIQKHLFKKFNNIDPIFHSYEGIRMPRLWSAPINHYRKEGNSIVIDTERQHTHLSWMSHYIDGHLINGSSGDGWELPINMQYKVAESVLNDATWSKPVLFGCLQHTIDDKCQIIDEYIKLLQIYLKCDSESEMLNKLYSHPDIPFVGFCINPTSNTSSQQEIVDGLGDILSKYSEYPFAIYQIPQMTDSEISSESLYKLCIKYENLILLKDTSENDHLVKSGEDFQGLFKIKGGDKHMINHLMPKRDGVLSYDGLMFSTANNYPVLLMNMMHSLYDGDIQDALNVSNQITYLFEGTYELVKHLRFGNPYTNCAKMVDYVMAFGEELLNNNDKHIPITNKGVPYDEKEIVKLCSLFKEMGAYQQDGTPYFLTKQQLNK